MIEEAQKPRRTISRLADIAIAALVGGIVGSVTVALRPTPSSLRVDDLQAQRITIRNPADSNFILLDSGSGIRLVREDYAEALLSFREPGTGTPGTGGPTLWLTGKNDTAFKATASGSETVALKRDATR